jgi:hypothetical protein
MPDAGVAHGVFPTLAPAISTDVMPAFQGISTATYETSEGEPRSERRGERILLPSVHFWVHHFRRKEHQMSLIQKEKKEVFKSIPIKFEQELAARLLAYADFLESSKDHVVCSALDYIMAKDRDFAAYLAEYGAASQNGKRTKTPAESAKG